MTEAITYRNRSYATYEAYALARDLDYIKKFLQSNCRYKTSYYEATKWGAYGAYYRITGTQGQNLVNLARLCHEHGVAFKPGRVTERVLLDAGATHLTGRRWS